MPQAIERMSEDAKVILLLCGHLARTSGVKPLSLGEYNQVARALRESDLRPADLLKPKNVPFTSEAARIDPERLAKLLERGMQLGLAIEEWNQGGVWVLCRSDSDYPERFKSHLADQAPAILFGVGNRSLLKGGGVAIVGSRNVDDAGRAFAQDVAVRCARGGMPVVSGGARGVDETAMSAALVEGGEVVGLLPDKLLRRSVKREARDALANGQLLLLTPYHPEAGFNIGNAMARNKLIYAMADYGLVVCATYNRGGTWAGAIEEMRRNRPRPIFVRIESTVPDGNKKLVDRGAIPFPESEPGPLTDDWFNEAVDAKLPAQIPLFQGLPLPDTVKEPVSLQAPSLTPPASIYEAIKPVLLNALDEPTPTAELAEQLEVSKSQMAAWIKRAVEEGAVRKLTRPVRYVREYDGTDGERKKRPA